MARSGYVWVVLDPATPVPDTFTVKHELVTWLGRLPDPSGLVIWRCRDGVFKQTPPRRVSLAELGILDSSKDTG